MTEQTIGLPGIPAKRGRLRALAARLQPRELRPATAWIVAAVLVALVGRHFWRDEGEFANILFAAAVTAALVALLTLIARRALFATVVVVSLVTIIVWAASTKRAMMNMVLHAYDIFFYLSSWSTVSYMWGDQRRYVVGLIAACLATGLVGWAAYRIDSTRIARRHAVLLLAAFLSLAGLGAYNKGERRHMQFYYSNLYVSSFYASWGETLETLWRGALLEAAPRGGATTAPFHIPSRCDVAARPPHIILIHQESLVQPSLFPTLRYDQSVDQLFRSGDQILHKMRVETYGGASWLTEFSLLAGVSTHSFGGMRQFVQTFTQGRLKDTLPQVLSRCGYRNVVFYPLLKNFVSNDRFYTSIGLKEIFDLKAQGAKSGQERDRFYFDNAMTEMDRHFKASRQPMFTFIQTMSAHWPYDVKYEPELDVPGGGPGTGPEMSEYLRRVSIAKMDYDYLVAELQRRFPSERFLIVHYGDHHPMATRTLLGYKDETEAEDVALDPDSIGFITYYAAQGVNYRLPALPQYDPLDVPYLGTVMLDLAGLPLSDSHRERKRLMTLCRGRYNSCPKRDEILQFHRRLIDSGVMAAR